MNDCPNAEIRDLLPDLLHDRLTATVRAQVLAHVDGCVDCREELVLLRELKAVVTVNAPRVDIAYVVNALPKPPQRNVVPLAPRRRQWADWRIAAALTLLVAGGSSVTLLRNRGSALPDTVAIATEAVTPAPMSPTVASAESATTSNGRSTQVARSRTPSADAPELELNGRLSGLDDQQLEALISEIESMKAVPMVEPDPVLIRVDTRNTSGLEEL